MKKSKHYLSSALFLIALLLTPIGSGAAVIDEANGIIETAHFRVHTKGIGENVDTVEITTDGDILLGDDPFTGAAEWGAEQRAIVARSLDNIERIFDFSGIDRKMEIGFVLKSDASDLGGSSGSFIYNNGQSVLTSEAKLRDDIDLALPEGYYDAAIGFTIGLPWHYGQGMPSSGTADFETVITHEIMHGLGIVGESFGGDGAFPDGVTRWESLLQDVQGGRPVYGEMPSLQVVGELGTIFWTGEHANEIYGGPVPIQTFIDTYVAGSSLYHPGVYGELMYWRVVAAHSSRDINKLQLAMMKDMGWKINEDYFNDFGPTYYRNSENIIHRSDHTSTFDYSYALHVNGENNKIIQEGNLESQGVNSKTFSVVGYNQTEVGGNITATGDYSFGYYGLTNDRITIADGARIEVTGEDSIGLVSLAANNTIIHSGEISAIGSADTAILVDYYGELDEGYVTQLHIQDGAIVEGDIVNQFSSSPSLITFGREYIADNSYGADADFSFTYADEIVGLWDYDFHSGTTTFTNGLTQQAGTFIKGNGIIDGNVNGHGTIAPGNSIGHLTIAGDLTQSSTSDIEIEFGDGGHDILTVSGTANLDGSITLLPIGYLQAGDYQFLNAGTINGNFATVNNFSSAVLETSAPSSNTFTLARNSYESVTGNSFAASLDGARITATGDMAGILNQLDLMAVTALKSATNDLSPHIYNSVTTASLEAAQSRSFFLRNKMKSESRSDSSPLWFLGYSGKSHYDKLSTSDEFTAQQKGFMLGRVINYPTDFSLGGGVSFTDFDLDEKNSTSNSSGSIYDLYLYGAWAPQVDQSFYIQAVLGAGFSDFDTDREITFLGRVANSEQDATHYSAFVGGGYNYTTGNWSIVPRIGIEYIYLNEDSFNETGADGASLSVNSKESDAVASSIGVNVSRNYQLERTILIPSLSIDWFHNFSTSTDGTTGKLQSGESYSVADRNMGKNAFEIGIGLKIVASDLVHGYIDYQHSFADEQDRSHMVSAGLSYKL